MFGKSKSGPKFYGLRGVWLHRSIGFIAGMGFLLFGYDQGVMGGLLTLENFKSYFPEMDDSTISGTVVAIYEIGCFLGALTAMWLGDKIGRRKMIFWGSIVMTIGAILQCSSYGLAQLIVGRIVTGYGNGYITSTVPTWQSEAAKPKERGRLVMISGALITGGIMISYWIDFAFYFVDNEADWRFPLAFQVVFAIIIFSFVLGLPESPRWLIKKGRIDEAREVFAALDDRPIDSHLVEAQVAEVRESLAEEAVSSTASVMRLFTFDKNRHFHRSMLAFWNQAFQQITGINLITYYAEYLFETSIGMSALNSRILAACNGTEYFLASWVAFYTIEKFGRRNLMIFGSIGQTLTMVILTITVWRATAPYSDSHAGIAAAVFLFVFNTFFAIGWLGMTWLYPAEITGLEIRAPANGLSTCANWLFNFMVVMVTPVSFTNIQYYTYTVFAALNLVILVATIIFYPETAGRSLEEIDRIFAQSNPKTPWDVVKIARDMPHHNADDEDTSSTNSYSEKHTAARMRSGNSTVQDEQVEHTEERSAV